jgi:hypothetical protein
MDIGAKSEEQEGFGKYMPNETVVDELLGKQDESANDIEMDRFKKQAVRSKYYLENPDEVPIQQEDITIDFNGTLGNPMKLTDLTESPNKMRTSLDSFNTKQPNQIIEEYSDKDSKGELRPGDYSQERWNH